MQGPVRSEISKHRLLPGASSAQEPKQRRLMVVALMLLLISLAFVLYRDRDFWFPDAEDATERPLEAPSTFTGAAAPPDSKPAMVVRKKSHPHPSQPATVAPIVEDPAPPLTVTRTVLPPLEVEVVAGSAHRTVRPGSNTVRVDMQPEAGAESAPQPSIQETDIPAKITTDAAERAPVATDSASVVSRAVQPGYPTLARQMKVQGAVTLQALIGRDGLIQDLHVLSGPPILAKAALEAVRQWHFKPHFQGAETVETEAKITVNFTISTN